MIPGTVILPASPQSFRKAASAASIGSQTVPGQEADISWKSLPDAVFLADFNQGRDGCATPIR